jgi:hypothetical protein
MAGDMKTVTKLICVAAALLAASGATAQNRLRPYFFGEAGGENTPAISASPQSTGGFTPPPSTGGLQSSSAAGGTQAAYGGGGGIEVLLSSHFGVGGEVEGLKPTQTGAQAVGIASGSLFVHFTNAVLGDKKFDPFVTAGYSAIFRDFGTNAGNVGGGLNYWFSENKALTISGRAVLGAQINSLNTKFFEFRIGMTFR